MDATQHQLSRSSVTEEEVLDVVMSGDETQIAAWVDFSLPLAKPSENTSEHASIINPDVERVLVRVLKRCPPSTRRLFRAALARKGVHLHSGDVNEVWDAVLKGDLLSVKHWVRSLPLHGVSLDAYARLVRKPTSELSDAFITQLVSVSARATPAMKELLLDELCRRGIIMPEDRPTPLDDDFFQALEAPELDSDDTPFRAPRAYDFTRLVARLARVGMLFRPRPERASTAIYDALLPFGRFSPLHYFVVNYLTSFEMHAVLEAYSAWYDIRFVSAGKFRRAREDVLQPTLSQVRRLFRTGQAGAALAAGCFFTPPGYESDTDRVPRGTFHQVDRQLFMSALLRFEYVTPLLTRIDVKDLAPTYAVVERRVADLAELLLALQISDLPQAQRSHGLFRVVENLQGCKSDATLFSYVFSHTDVNPDAFFNKSPWPPRLDEDISPEQLAQRNAEQRALAILRDWLRHRSPVSAAHYTLANVCPHNVPVWDALAALTIRVALANFQPSAPPKYEFDAEADEFERLHRGPPVEQEIVNTALSYLDMITSQDTVDTVTLSLYLDAAECFARFHPDIFGPKRLMHQLDKAFIAGRTLRKDLRRPLKYLAEQPELISIKQLPNPIRKLFTGLGLVYSKDTTSNKEKKAVLRLLTSFFMLYGVAFSSNLSNTWKRVEGAPTATLMRWMLGMSGVLRMPPEALGQQLAYSNGLFIERPEVLQHLLLLIGPESSLLPAFREHGDDHTSPVWDKTTQFLAHMPANIDLPRPGVSQGRWLGNEMLAHALRSIDGDVPFDSALPALALEQGARRQDCFMACMLAHEAAFERLENRHRDADRVIAIGAEAPAGPEFEWFDIEKTMLRLAGRHSYVILKLALDLFYPKSAVAKLTSALLALRAGRYFDARHDFLQVVPVLTAGGRDMPSGFHVREQRPKWTEEMVEEMMRSAFGVECEMPAPSAHDRHWLKELFSNLEFKSGLDVLAELEDSFKPKRSGAPEPDFLSSEKIYDEKLAEFREFIAPDMFLWEHRWERERFAAEAYEQFGEAGASPVVTGAIFFSMWDHFKYQETRVPLDEFSPEEEVQLLFTAVQQWEKCDQEVYGEVVFTLRARIYTLMLAHNLDGLRVTVGESRIELKTQAFFPHSRLPAPKPDENTKAVAAAAAAVNAEPARAPDFVFKDEYTAEQRAGALDDADYLDALPESADPNDVGRPIPSEGGDGGAPGSSSDEDEDESKAHEEEDGATPRAAPDFAAEIEKEMARAAAEEAAAQRELEAGFVSGRMDIAGFMVYQSLKPHHYMPEAALWERRWDQQAEIEKHASLSATPLEQLQDRLAAAGVERAGKDESGRPLDTRVLDVELFIEVMDRLLYNAQFQLAFLLAQDVRAYYPLIFSNLLPDLEKHLHRVRLVFYVSGIDKLKSSDLGLAPPLPPGPGKRAKWRKPKVSKAADFANIPWLPTDAKNDYVLVSRRRMSWNSTTKIDPIRYLLISLFPRIDPTQVQAAMTGDKKSGKSLNAQAVLRTFAKEEPELARVAELFITALMIHDAEQRHSDTSLARTLAAMVEVQNDGTLPLMIRIAEALDNSSVLSILTMHPSMVVHELMRNQNDFRLIRQYLRAAVPDDSSPNAVKYLKEAYVFFLEQRVEEEVRALEEAELEAKRAAISLKGEAWKARQREIKAQSERRAREGLEAGWSRNRLIAFAACVGERRQMHDLGQAFLDVARSVDISAHADMRGLGSVQALQILKMELFYAAYFAFFASSHLSGMQATLREIDDTLLRLRGSPSRFRLFAQRTLFLTGEYRALRRSIGHVVQEQRSAKLRKKIRAKAQKKLDQDLRAIRAKRKQLKAAMRAERAAMGDLPSDDDSSDEELADDLPEPDLEQSPAELEFAQQHAQAIEETVRDDEEVELASKRDALVLGLLRTLQNLQGYQLFSELEKIAASFKDLAEEFAEHNWYRQSLDCHYISELVHVEMEYIPAKLRRMNFVDPDEYEFNQIWRHYSTCLPLKVLLERQDRERAAAERAGGGGGEGGEGGEGGGGGAAVPRGKSVRLLSLQGPSRRELVGAGGEGDPYDMDPVDNPDQLSPEQLEVLIGDCILSGVQGRFLERERREFAVEAKRLEAEGKAPGRVYKHLHNLIARTVDQFMQLLDGSPLLPDELRDIIVAQGEEMLEFDSSRDHGADDTHVEERKYPSTVLFIMRDRFGKWSLGVGPTNLTAAQQSLRILSHLNKADQVSLFRDFYFSNQYA